MAQQATVTRSRLILWMGRRQGRCRLTSDLGEAVHAQGKTKQSSSSTLRIAERPGRWVPEVRWAGLTCVVQ